MLSEHRDPIRIAKIGIVWTVAAFLMLISSHLIVHASQGTCPEDRDTVTGSSALWLETAVGVNINQPCAAWTSGSVYRRCVADLTAPSGGSWTPPDVTECSNDQLTDLNNYARRLVGGRSPRTQDVIHTLDEMTQLTGDAVTNESLYPSDIISSLQVLSKVSTKFQGYGDVHILTNNLTESYTKAMSRMTGRSTLPAWDNFVDLNEMIETARQLLQSAENFAFNLITVKNQYKEPWSNIIVHEEGLDFEMAVIPELFNMSDVISMTDPGGAGVVTFPPEIFNISKKALLWQQYVFGYYRSQFETMKDILGKEDIPNPRPGAEGALRLNSVVLSAAVVGVHGVDTSNLSDPVIITLRHAEQIDNAEGSCYALNMSSESAEYRWTSAGCHVAHRNASHTTCHCYHLTNFALLMDIFNVDLTPSHQVALSFISYIGGSLSVIGCLLSVIIYQFFRLGNERIRIHEMLAASIILSQLSFFIGFERTENTYVCRVFAVLTHLFLTSMFCWMLVEGMHLYVSLVKVFRRSSHFRKYCIIGWGIPVVNVAVSVTVFLDEYGGPDYCWITTRVLLFAFVPFVAVTIVVNVFVLVKVLRVMLRSMGRACKTRNEDLSTTRVSFKAVVTLMPLLGLTWSFGFLSITSRGTLIFTYLFCICNSLQGVFFFIFHCMLNIDVQRAYSRRYRPRTPTGSSLPRPPAKDSTPSTKTTLTPNTSDKNHGNDGAVNCNDDNGNHSNTTTSQLSASSGDLIGADPPPPYGSPSYPNGVSYGYAYWTPVCARIPDMTLNFPELDRGKNSDVDGIYLKEEARNKSIISADEIGVAIAERDRITHM